MWSLALKLGLSLVLLGVMVARLDLAQVMREFAAIGPLASLAALGLCLAQAVLLGYRWQRVLRAGQVEMTVAAAVRMAFVGLFFNQCLPTSVGGDGVRVLMLRASLVPLPRAVNLVLADRLSGLAGLLPWLLLGLPFQLLWSADPLLSLALAGLCAAFLAAIVGYFLGDRLIARFGRLATVAPLRAVAAAAAEARQVVVVAPGAAMTALLAVVSQLITVLIVWVLAAGLGAALSPLAALVLVPAVIAAAMLPISFGGWGAREAAMIAVLGLVGVAPTTALAISLGWGIMLLLSTLPGAVLWLAGGRVKPADGPA